MVKRGVRRAEGVVEVDVWIMFLQRLNVWLGGKFVPPNHRGGVVRGEEGLTCRSCGDKILLSSLTSL